MTQDIISFSQRWKGKGDEKSDTQKFWLELIRDVLGLEFPEYYIDFENRVRIDRTSYIDAYIPSTGIVIEQKSIDVDLDAPAKQSDGTLATPFQQAKRYYDNLIKSQRGNYIIVCNFKELRIHNMDSKDFRIPERIITLEDIEKERDNLSFIINPDRIYTHEEGISIKAGMLAKKLRDELRTRYVNPDDDDAKLCLNIFCVRVVFLLYAEDALIYHDDSDRQGMNLFEKSGFHDYLKDRTKTARQSLKELFQVLNQKPAERDPYLEDDLKKFPYVNGGLFERQDIEIPQLDGEPLRIILEDMSEKFDWSEISPTIFGAVFERVLNDAERHSDGIHYTTSSNIHKAIDTLFLDDLRVELDEILSMPPTVITNKKKLTADDLAKTRERKLQAFHDKLASLIFFDPACGSGNFLTETYISLRRLENEVLFELDRQKYIAFSKEELHIKVNLSQFYGIEINPFAVAVAQTALYIAETQMLNETKSAIKGYQEQPLPLESYDNIKTKNALTIDWAEIVTPSEKLYIIGNPPFMGYSGQTPRQKEEIQQVYKGDYNKAGKVDYVSCWYYKAAEFMAGSKTQAAFVSTNSIVQGEQVAYVWKPLMKRMNVGIDFAHLPFVWESDSGDKAKVHVVVLGFNTMKRNGVKKLFTPEGVKIVKHINAYLVEGPDVFAEARPDPINPEEASPMILGNLPRDGGNLSFTPEELHDFLKLEPKAEKFIRRYMGADEFINGKERYCLWLVDSSPQELRDMPQIMERIKLVKEFRLSSTREATRKLAKSSWLFAEVRQPKTNYIIVPRVSSEKRSYIPMGFMSPEVIVSDAVSIIPNATLYQFGVLTSRIHMGWMRRVCGRLKSDYRYSGTIVYNCFAWPSPTQRQREKIESTAQEILDARSMYPDSTYASLYDDDVMPLELRRAHERNDAAVCEAYGWRKDISEFDAVAKLFDMYYAVVGDDD